MGLGAKSGDPIFWLRFLMMIDLAQWRRVGNQVIADQLLIVCRAASHTYSLSQH